MPNKLKVYKKSGKVQRSDIRLTKDIATMLQAEVLKGKSLFSSKEIILRGQTERIVIKAKTLQMWIYRNAVIPETGEVLRDFLDQARAEYRSKEREKRQEEMVRNAEKRIGGIIAMPTKEPVVGMFGKITDKKTGEVVMRENPHLVDKVLNASKFALERLDPGKYGKVDRSMNKHLVFSLADLAKAVEEDERQKQNEV